MATSFAWLDASQRDRRRALDVIDLLSVRETRDELGIGSIRDALADLLAPGLSTVQTRAKYFLFVPWAYQRLEARCVGASALAKSLRASELELRDVLVASGDPDGTVGRNAGRSIQRLPSSIYWHGLEVLGIRRARGSTEGVARGWGRTDPPRDPEEVATGGSIRGHVWDPHLPPAPKGFPAGAAFDLHVREASYLRERFRQRAPDALVTFLIEHEVVDPGGDLPWDVPRVVAATGRLGSVLDHARCFSEVMHGAALLYNLMLSELLERADWLATYQDRLEAWSAMASARRDAHVRWDQPAFWAVVLGVNPRIAPAARTFVSAWTRLLLEAGRPADLVGSGAARELVRVREVALKRNRSRLRHRQYLELWQGAAGASQLDYRWGTVRSVVRDIVRGLSTEAGDA
ncbi:MAG: hypothetical protein KDB73_18125 [Planctomycetes bacterium]|nr:hypothetical protein [Planctomycetota bacterium]